MSLVENLICASGVLGSFEKVVETHFVQGRRARVRGNVPANGNSGTLSPMHHDRGIPADHCANPTLHELVPGEPRFVVRCDRVDVVGAAKTRDTYIVFSSPAQKLQHEEACSVVAAVLDQTIK